MESRSIESINKVALALLAAVFALNVYRAATQSITVPEAVAFDRWIRPPLRDILPQPYDPANHILITLLIKRTVALFRLSEFSFRLPSLLGDALYLWVAYRLSRRLLGTGRLFLAALALMSLAPPSLALALFTWAIELMLTPNLNLAGICLGLSAASDLAFLLPAIALATAFLIVTLVREPARWLAVAERFVIPTVVTGFVFLAIPLSHAQATSLHLWQLPIPHWPQDSGARSLVQALRRDAVGRHVEIGASPGLEPILTFYRACYRLSNWEPMRHKPLTGNFDYYVLDRHDATLVSERHLQVIYRGPALLLARSSP